MLWLTVYPMITVFLTSFQNYNYISGLRRWIGLGNYRNILTDQVFLTSFKNTIVYCFSTTFLEVFLGTALALVFYGNFRGKSIFTILLILPMMLSTMVVSSVWKTLFHYDIGLLNTILSQIGLLGWAGSSTPKWRCGPWCSSMCGSGRRSPSSSCRRGSPRFLRKCSKLPSWTERPIGKGFFRITLPILRDQILLLCLLRTIDTFKIFSKVFALTAEVPATRRRRRHSSYTGRRSSISTWDAHRRLR